MNFKRNVDFIFSKVKLKPAIFLLFFCFNFSQSSLEVNVWCSVYSSIVEKDQPPHIILDATKNPIISEIAKSFTSVLGLPTISGSFGQDGDIQQWRDINDEKRKYLLQVMPPADVIPHIIPLIASRLNLTNAAILFDDTFETTSDEYFERNFAWYAITQDLGRVDICCKNVSVFFIRPKLDSVLQEKQIESMKTPIKYTEIASVFYFDLFLRAVLSVKDMMSTNHWPTDMEFITCNNYNGSNTPERSIDLRSHFVNVTEPTTYGEFLLPNDTEKFNGNSKLSFEMEIFKVSGKSYRESLGDWTAGLENPLKVAKVFDSFKPMRVYRVYTVLKPPFMMRDNSTKRGYRGLCIDLMDTIAALCNFDYTINETDENGRMDENGTWNGIVRKLVDQDADIGLGAMQMTIDRERVVDFTIPYYDLVGYTILMKIKYPRASFFKFVTIIDISVWGILITTFTLTFSFLYGFERFSPYSLRNNRQAHEHDAPNIEFTLKECLWYTTISFTSQGGGDTPKSVSSRMVAITWWLFAFITIASYTANIAAYLTLSRLKKPVENLDELARQYKFLYAPILNSEAMDYFEQMSNIEGRFYEIWKEMTLNTSLSALERSKITVWDYPIGYKYTKIWEAMKEANMPKTLDEAVARVRKSKLRRGFAFIGDASDIYYTVATNCGFKVLGKEFSQKPYALALQKGSPLKEEIDAALTKMLRENYPDKLKEKYMKKTLKCPNSGDPQHGLEAYTLGGVFLFAGIGILISYIVMIYEYWYLQRRGLPKILQVAERAEGTINALNTVHHIAAMLVRNYSQETDEPNLGDDLFPNPYIDLESEVATGSGQILRWEPPT